MGCEPQGRREVGQAVLIAGLSEIVIVLVNWGFGALRDRAQKAKEQRATSDAIASIRQGLEQDSTSGLWVETGWPRRLDRVDRPGEDGAP